MRSGLHVGNGHHRDWDPWEPEGDCRRNSYRDVCRDSERVKGCQGGWSVSLRGLRVPGGTQRYRREVKGTLLRTSGEVRGALGFFKKVYGRKKLLVTGSLRNLKG